MDAVLTNARIVTSDDGRPAADTVVIRDGRFAFVGSAADAPPVDDLSRHDLGGRLVLPGLIDAHTHPEMLTLSRWHVRLPETDDVDELLAFIRDYGRAHPKEEAPYLYFEYYPSTLFGEGGPTKELLDTAISDRPVLCQDFSDHAHWINSRMLELLGVTRDTPDPVPGLEMFVRDADGEPTGHVLEMAYAHFLEPMYEAIGWRPPAVTAEGVDVFLGFLREHGVTALFEALVVEESSLAAIAELDRAGRLDLHYEGAVRFRTSADVQESIATVQRWQRTYGSEHVRVRTVKLFLDGTNESANSAVLAPFVDAPERGLGEIQMETPELTECLLALDAAGVDVHIHLVGDRAFRVACDAVEAAKARAGDAWRIQVTVAHCELIDPADMRRPAELGIAVNWTMHWSGGYFGEESRAHLGAERFDRMYDFTAIADSGAVLAFSSDVVSTAEEHRANPFFGMQVAATRVDPDEPLDPARYPGSVRPSAASRLSLERLVRGSTIDAARQLRLDDRIGSIEVGKCADLVVLDDDLFAMDLDRLATVRPRAVLKEGRLVAGAL